LTSYFRRGRGLRGNLGWVATVATPGLRHLARANLYCDRFFELACADKGPPRKTRGSNNPTSRRPIVVKLIRRNWFIVFLRRSRHDASGKPISFRMSQVVDLRADVFARSSAGLRALADDKRLNFSRHCLNRRRLPAVCTRRE